MDWKSRCHSHNQQLQWKESSSTTAKHSKLYNHCNLQYLHYVYSYITSLSYVTFSKSAIFHIVQIQTPTMLSDNDIIGSDSVIASKIGRINYIRNNKFSCFLLQAFWQMNYRMKSFLFSFHFQALAINIFSSFICQQKLTAELKHWATTTKSTLHVVLVVVVLAGCQWNCECKERKKQISVIFQSAPCKLALLMASALLRCN